MVGSFKWYTVASNIAYKVIVWEKFAPLGWFYAKVFAYFSPSYMDSL